RYIVAQGLQQPRQPAAKGGRFDRDQNAHLHARLPRPQPPDFVQGKAIGNMDTVAAARCAWGSPRSKSYCAVTSPRYVRYSVPSTSLVPLRASWEAAANHG